MFDVVLKDLQSRFGPKVLLSPEDIAQIINTSVGQQANLRSENRFPIPYEKDDLGRVKISIYDLAKYIASHGKKEVKRELALVPEKLTRQQKKAKKGHLEGAWWTFRSSHIIAIVRRSILENEIPHKPQPKKILKI